ncbi:MAG: cobyrinic acid a,c-diamide synthase, partial [Rhodospirillaceae bacterium]
MVLGETLTDADGRDHAMLGLLPLATSFAAPKLHLGYRDAALVAAGPLGGAGARFRGHEFHYAEVTAEAGAEPLFRACNAAGANLGPAGLVRGAVAGSFLHLIDRCAA